jgi:hypothetical protein
MGLGREDEYLTTGLWEATQDFRAQAGLRTNGSAAPLLDIFVDKTGAWDRTCLPSDRTRTPPTRRRSIFRLPCRSQPTPAAPRRTIAVTQWPRLAGTSTPTLSLET